MKIVGSRSNEAMCSIVRSATASALAAPEILLLLPFPAFSLSFLWSASKLLVVDFDLDIDLHYHSIPFVSFLSSSLSSFTSTHHSFWDSLHSFASLSLLSLTCLLPSSLSFVSNLTALQQPANKLGIDTTIITISSGFLPLKPSSYLDFDPSHSIQPSETLALVSPSSNLDNHPVIAFRRIFG